MIRRTFSALLCLSALLSTAPMIQAHEAGKQMAEVAALLLSVLTPEQKAKATFAFEDEERINWHFIPRERKGLPLKEMTPQQELLSHALLNTGLGFRGAAKAATIGAAFFTLARS